MQLTDFEYIYTNTLPLRFFFVQSAKDIAYLIFFIMAVRTSYETVIYIDLFLSVLEWYKYTKQRTLFANFGNDFLIEIFIFVGFVPILFVWPLQELFIVTDFFPRMGLFGLLCIFVSNAVELLKNIYKT